MLEERIAPDEIILRVEDLHVQLGGREILKGVDLTIHRGETHILFGPNGSGKTTLLYAIMGLPGCEPTVGRISFRGQDITALGLDERARLGMGLAFQRPPIVAGVRLGQFLKVIYSRAGMGPRASENMVNTQAQGLKLVPLLDRDLNRGFSGGESKRSELLQLLVQKPEFVLLDEPESGVDLDSLAMVGGAVNALLKGDRVSERSHSGLIVTHTGHILSHVNADVGHVLYGGRLACRGNPRDLLVEIAREGYERCVHCHMS